MAYSIEWIMEATGGTLLTRGEKSSVDGFSIDSREITSEQAFIAIKGERFDGHDFVHDCINKGVEIFIVRKNFLRGQNKYLKKSGATFIGVRDTVKALGNIAKKRRETGAFRVVAITGSSGKTTTRHLIAHILSKKYRVYEAQKSFNNEIGVPLTILSAPKNTEIIVMEIGMNHKGEIRKLSSISQPNISVITNIGYAHIGFLGSLKAIAQEKSDIFEGMKKGIAVLNRDDEFFEFLKRKAEEKGLNIISFSESDIKLINAVSFSPLIEIEGKKIHIPLSGKHNIANLSAAVKVAEIFGIPKLEAVSYLKDFSTPPMRTEIIKDKFTIISDCYNSNPSSLMASLEMLSDLFCAGRKFAIIGDMLELGKHSKKLHRLVGSKLPELDIDYVFTYGRDAFYITEEAVKRGFPENRALHFDNLAELAEALDAGIKKNDIVLVKASRALKLERVVEHLKALMEEM